MITGEYAYAFLQATFWKHTFSIIALSHRCTLPRVPHASCSIHFEPKCPEKNPCLMSGSRSWNPPKMAWIWVWGAIHRICKQVSSHLNPWTVSLLWHFENTRMGWQGPEHKKNPSPWTQPPPINRIVYHLYKLMQVRLTLPSQLKAKVEN